MKPGFVTRAEVAELVDDIGEVTGSLRRDVDTMAELYVELGERIANLETRIAELTAPKRSRSPRRRRLQVLDAIAAE